MADKEYGRATALARTRLRAAHPGHYHIYRGQIVAAAFRGGQEWDRKLEKASHNGAITALQQAFPIEFNRYRDEALRVTRPKPPKPGRPVRIRPEMSVPCPKCRAEVKAPCVGPTAVLHGYFHAARVNDYQAEVKVSNEAARLRMAKHRAKKKDAA